MSRKPFRHTPKKRRGAAAVEFAVVSPILAIVVIGVVDVGRAVMVQQMLTNAARDACRTAVLDSASASDVISQCETYLASASVPGASATIDPNPLTAADDGDPVTVSVSVPFSSVSWLPTSVFLNGVTLEGSVVMRRESSAGNPL